MTHEANGLVFGLVWETAISDTQSELVKLAKEVKANSFTEVSYDHGKKYGFASLKKVGELSAAAAVFVSVLTEEADSEGIFIHDLAPDKTCFIAIANHLPVMGLSLIHI